MCGLTLEVWEAEDKQVGLEMGRGINTELQLTLATRGQLFSEAVTWSTLGFTDLEGATSRVLNAITEACTEMHVNPCYTCKGRVGQSMDAKREVMDSCYSLSCRGECRVIRRSKGG